MEISKYEKDHLIILAKLFRQYFARIATVKLVQFLRLSQTILSNSYYWNAFAQWNNNVTCENCGTTSTRFNFFLHKRRCSFGSLSSSSCLKISAESQSHFNYHFPKKQSAPKLDVTSKFKPCYEEFPGFYALWQH